ncbi:MAG: hypothetical protein IPH85_12375 [Ignavibacteria bacterium]|nr:hypothetical protein [Ignavibacteria bacterium]
MNGVWPSFHQLVFNYPNRSRRSCGAGAGLAAGFDDAAYQTAGATVASRSEVIAAAATIIRGGRAESRRDRRNAQRNICGLYIYPKRHRNVLDALAAQGVNAFALDAMPRITRAQSMDVPRRRTTLAGYKAVILGANSSVGSFR